MMLKDRNGPVFLDELSLERGASSIEIIPEYSIRCMAAEEEIFGKVEAACR